MTDQMLVPRDLEVILPLPNTLLHCLLIVSFLLHILFVNLMVGGSILCLIYEWRGLAIQKYDRLAKAIAETVTVNKSLAVVMGVAPLLTINTIYTVYFYSANALTGYFWIAVVPWVTVCFLALYWHKYSWFRMRYRKRFHLSVLLFVVLSFLFIPLIFLSNINLMLFPDSWDQVSGFFSTLTVGNVFPRYLHFIVASIALTALFLYGYFIPVFYQKKKLFTDFSKIKLKREFLSIVFYCTLGQFLVGAMVYFTLPNLGVNWTMLSFLLPAIGLVIAASIFLYRLLYVKNHIPRYAFGRVVFLFGAVVVCMAFTRNIYRETVLDNHRTRVASYTSEIRSFMDAEIKKNELLGDNLTTKIVRNDGKKVYDSKCKMCHSYTTKLVGPPLMQVLPNYRNNRTALENWIRNPGRKQKEYSQMVGFPSMKSDEMEELLTYLLTELK